MDSAIQLLNNWGQYVEISRYQFVALFLFDFSVCVMYCRFQENKITSPVLMQEDTSRTLYKPQVIFMYLCYFL